MHKSTVHRLLATLEEKQFVKRNPKTGTYSLGVNMLHMAYLTLEQNDLRHIAHPFLRRLKDLFQETINLSVLDGSYMIYLDIIESDQRVKLAAATGQKLPAFCTASGKAFLAHASDEIVQRVLDAGMPSHTENTITDIETYQESLKLIREVGFATSIEEFEVGINAVAAPILDINSSPIGAIAVAGPSFRLTKEEMLKIGPVLVDTAREIGREIKIIGNDI